MTDRIDEIQNLDCWVTGDIQVKTQKYTTARKKSITILNIAKVVD